MSMARWSIRPSTPGRSIVPISERGCGPDGSWIRTSPTITVRIISTFMSSPRNREIVERNHGVRFRPQTDFPGVFETFILCVQHFVAVVRDHEMVARRFDLERVPDVRGHFDVV